MKLPHAHRHKSIHEAVNQSLIKFQIKNTKIEKGEGWGLLWSKSEASGAWFNGGDGFVWSGGGGGWMNLHGGSRHHGERRLIRLRLDQQILMVPVRSAGAEVDEEGVAANGGTRDWGRRCGGVGFSNNEIRVSFFTFIWSYGIFVISRMFDLGWLTGLGMDSAQVRRVQWSRVESEVKPGSGLVQYKIQDPFYIISNFISYNIFKCP